MAGRFIAILLGMLLFQTVTGRSCQNTSSIPLLQNLQNRSLDDIFDLSLLNNNDLNIKEDWYRAVVDGIQYQLYTRRPDDNLDFGMCGAYYPIYLEQHQDVDNLTETPVEAQACVFEEYFYCDIAYTVKIRKCGNEVQYYLPSTRKYSGYCFVPLTPLTTTSATTTPPSTTRGSMQTRTTLHVSTPPFVTDVSTTRETHTTTVSVKPVKPPADDNSGQNTTIITTIVVLVVLLLIVSVITVILYMRYRATKRKVEDTANTKEGTAVVVPTKNEYSRLDWGSSGSVRTASTGYTSYRDVSDTETLFSTLSAGSENGYDYIRGGTASVHGSPIGFTVDKGNALPGQGSVHLDDYLVPSVGKAGSTTGETEERVYDVIK